MSFDLICSFSPQRNKIYMNRTFTILLTLMCASTLSLRSQTQDLAIGFYNLENLFDTIDDPDVLDTEFTPSGEKNWTMDKYEDKLNRLGKVIRTIEHELKDIPLAILAVCEIENRKVLEDLVRNEYLKSRYYKIVHQDSRDLRGIDVALLYQAPYFTVLSTSMHPVHLPDVDGVPRITRDVLMVKGLLAGKKIFITVNHWPSRRGGEEATKEFRMAAALVNKHLSDSVKLTDPGAGFIITGDLNDNPDNASLVHGIKARKKKTDLDPGSFYNPFYSNYTKGEGTTAYQDSWSLFDQILISSNLVNSDADLGITYKSNRIFRKRFMIENEGHFKHYPKRTFSGNLYNSGYSDHFPVYCLLSVRGN